MSQADSVAEVRENPAKRDPALAFMDRALEEIHSALMTFGCWPEPQPRKSLRVRVDLDSYFNERHSAKDLDTMLADLFCDMTGEYRSALRSRIAPDILDWLKGSDVVHERAAELAREAQADAEDAEAVEAFFARQERCEL